MQLTLTVPVVKDRIVQTAVKLVIEPIFEATFLDSSYGFRPQRSAHDALREVDRLLREGYTHVVDADLKSYLDRTSYCPPDYEVTSNKPGCSSNTLILKPFLRP